MKKFSYKKLDKFFDDECLNASAVAKKAGVSVNAISNMRNGTKVPKINTLAAVAFVLDKSVDFFLEDEAIVNQTSLPLSTTLKEAVNG
jgi:transcriptional regulator with XRE-family HTH domain